MLTIKQVQADLESKRYSCQELVTRLLAQIKQDNLNDFITLLEKSAQIQAQAVDQKIKQGEKLKDLEGIPIAIKDNILIKGIKATAASQMLSNYQATYDATVIAKLRSRGAIFLGKTNLDEFAMGASNETSYYGPVLNPHDYDRVPGGSSGGSAAAVAAEHCILALGSDTGGSIRQPAAFCGVWGLKSSYGTISRRGLIALASSLDQIGCLAASLEDLATSYNTIQGKDLGDMTSLTSSEVDLGDLNTDLKGKIIGVPQDYYQSSIDPVIKDSLEKALQQLQERGAKIKTIDLSFLDEALAAYYIIQPAEASTNLARYDGFRYGYHQEANNLAQAYLNNRDSLGEEVKRRIIVGTYVLSAGYKDAYYDQAKKVQADIQQRFKEIFKQVYALILPTTPSRAFKLGEKINDPVTMYLSDIFTVMANIAGLPAMNVPVLTKDLPVGLQIVGGFLQEKSIFHTAYNLIK